MQIVTNRDKLHEMLNPVLLEKYKKKKKKKKKNAQCCQKSGKG